MNTKTKDVAETQGGELILNESLPAHLQDQQGGRGAENVGTEDLQLPRIKLLQALSPEVAGRGSTGNVGQFCNTLTGEITDEILVVPVYYYRKFLTWANRDKRPDRGLIGVFDTEAEAIDAREELDEETGDRVNFTPTFIVLLYEGGEWVEASLPMPSTKIKVAKRWNSLIRQAKVDSFAKAYKLDGDTEESKGNDTWRNINVVPQGYVNEDVYRQAEELYMGLHSGDVVVSNESFNEGESDTPF